MEVLYKDLASSFPNNSWINLFCIVMQKLDVSYEYMSHPFASYLQEKRRKKRSLGESCEVAQHIGLILRCPIVNEACAPCSCIEQRLTNPSSSNSPPFHLPRFTREAKGLIFASYTHGKNPYEPHKQLISAQHEKKKVLNQESSFY